MNDFNLLLQIWDHKNNAADELIKKAALWFLSLKYNIL